MHQHASGPVPAPAPHLEVSVERRRLERARLVFARGTAHVTLGAWELDDHLVVASFFKRIPQIAAEREGTVVIRYPWTSMLDYRAFSAEIALATGVDWAIESEDGQVDTVLDLRAARLGTVSLRGGQCDVTLKLPPVQGIVPVSLEGGAFNVNVLHPPGVAVAVEVTGGVDDCTFDGRHVAALDADLRLPSEQPAPGYRLRVTGGATRVRVDSVQ